MRPSTVNSHGNTSDKAVTCTSNTPLPPLLQVSHWGPDINVACSGDAAVHVEVFRDYHTNRNSDACFVAINATIEKVSRGQRRGRRQVDASSCVSTCTYQTLL